MLPFTCSTLTQLNKIKFILWYWYSDLFHHICKSFEKSFTILSVIPLVIFCQNCSRFYSLPLHLKELQILSHGLGPSYVALVHWYNTQCHWFMWSTVTCSVRTYFHSCAATLLTILLHYRILGLAEVFEQKWSPRDLTVPMRIIYKWNARNDRCYSNHQLW